MQVSVVQFRPWAPPLTISLPIQTLTKGGTRTRQKVGHVCSRFLPLFEQVHCCFCELFLIGLARVLLCLFDRVPTEDRHQLTRCRTVVCCDGRARLAQSMRRTAWQVRLIAPIAKFVAESGMVNVRRWSWTDYRAKCPRGSSRPCNRLR